MFKGLALSFFIILLFLTAVPLGITFAMIGPDDYARQCKMTPIMPCFGLGE